MIGRKFFCGAFAVLAKHRKNPFVSCSYFRQLSSTTTAQPVFTTPAPAPRADNILIGPLGPLQNQDIKSSTVILSPAFTRHRTVIPFGNSTSRISCETFLSPNSVVVGNVIMGDRTSVWNGSVIRGDENGVEIGAVTAILENTVITTDCDHTDISIDTDGTGGRVSGFPGSVKIGDYVTIEPGCVLRACTVESNVIIGAGSVICEGSLIEGGAIVGPGSIVPPGRRVPAGQLWTGRPVEFVRDLDSVDEAQILKTAETYYVRTLDHIDATYPLETYSLLHRQALTAIESQ